MKKLFLHMPKCAGTSIRKLLDMSPSVSLELDYESYFKIPRPDRNPILMKCLLQPTKISTDKIVYGHFFPIKYLGSEAPGELKMVTILRDPISRLKSHYAFWNSGDYSDHYIWRKMKSQNWSFYQFAFSDEMRNIYSQYFSGISIAAFDYIGLFENMNASVASCLSILGIEVDARLVLPRERVTTYSVPIEISAEVARELRDHHADDYLIYEFAKEKFHSKR